uniref:Uncharacterized protein n=1 Tax=uncultured planctomycete 6N14 TaxID=455069 RepID=A9LGV4_9BACT|nr:hypothetical protein 6N14_32 [uncultured planctomycete 6N14]
MPDSATASIECGPRYFPGKRWNSRFPVFGSKLRGDESHHFRALVHKLIPPEKLPGIQEAADAVEKEWKKLEAIQSWDVTQVQNKRDVQRRARETSVKIHFGSLRALCHLKNAELEAFLQQYKGRVIFIE